MSIKKARRNKHYPVAVSKLFGKLLPDNYRQKTATIHHYQQFFNSQSSDAVFQMVQVMNVNDDCITLAVPSSALVNYLRLHSSEIRQQIFEQFDRMLALNIIAEPQLMSPAEQKNQLPPAKHFSRSVCDQLKKSAASVDDDKLKAALVSLSKTIRNDD